jgi:predicted nucleic acid-binding Zn ribbon protein
MPLYEYACECGTHLEVLVRGGREPSVASDAGHVCDSGGRLIRVVTAAAVGGSGGNSKASADPMCGSCGRVPGSCQYD